MCPPNVITSIDVNICVIVVQAVTQISYRLIELIKNLVVCRCVDKKSAQSLPNTFFSCVTLMSLVVIVVHNLTVKNN